MVSICEAESFDQRLERFSSFKDKHKRHEDNIIIVRKRFLGDVSGWIKEWFFTENLVTNNGAQYYAEAGTDGNTPFTVNFADTNGRMELGDGVQPTPNATNTYSALAGPISGSRKAITSGYPKTNDTNPDNTGAGIRTTTWYSSWLTTDFSDTNITGGVIHDAGNSPVAASVLLTFWTITAFSKTATDTLEIFVNHTMAGV